MAGSGTAHLRPPEDVLLRVENLVVEFPVGRSGLKVNAVPEPETYALMLAGLSAVGFIARRRRGRSQA